MVEHSSGTNLSYRGDIVGIEDGTSLHDSKYYDDDGRVKRTGIMNVYYMLCTFPVSLIR